MKFNLEKLLLILFIIMIYEIGIIFFIIGSYLHSISSPLAYDVVMPSWGLLSVGGIIIMVVNTFIVFMLFFPSNISIKEKVPGNGNGDNE